uniref:Secreted protein n=1 Tax=Opuntia streptacantha TaxID=393608 RepID=A0A7C9E331_OPUST
MMMKIHNSQMARHLSGLLWLLSSHTIPGVRFLAVVSPSVIWNIAWQKHHLLLPRIQPQSTCRALDTKMGQIEQFGIPLNVFYVNMHQYLAFRSTCTTTKGLEREDYK